LATALADQDTDVLIVDEADMILNTGYRLFGQQGEVDKGWVNDFVDKNPAKIIWITNEVSLMDESLLRRFAYNVRFSVPARSKREEIWIREVQTQKLIGKVPHSLIRLVSSKYQLTPAAISSALSTLRRFIQDKALKDGAISGALEEILRTRQSLLQRSTVREAIVVDDKYTLEALHADQDLDSIAGLVSRHFENQNMNTGVNILFWGLPGTGKTEFARHLAARVGVDLIDRKASELLNLFVGETEKNIRRAFEEAEEQRAILLLDEADSFLRERETAQHSWEMTQVNELLTNMETHRGVLICSTNLIDSFDRASLRRFAFKVQFKPLTSEGRIAIYKRHFSTCYGSLNDVERSSLDNLPDLTLGDFKAVWTRLCLLREGPQENKIVLQALKEESSYRSRRGGEIGFRQDE
jgi:SpoVK/Ycf46/Vps4 family AAA+-type ATPase